MQEQPGKKSNPISADSLPDAKGSISTQSRPPAEWLVESGRAEQSAG
jgi:hypothetical protein